MKDEKKNYVLQNTKEIVVDYEDTYQKSNEFGRGYLSEKMTTQQYQLLAFLINRTQHVGGMVFHKSELEKQYGKKFSSNQLYKDTNVLTDLKVSFAEVDEKKAAMNDENSIQRFGHTLVFEKILYEDGMIYARWSYSMHGHLLNISKPYFVNSLDVIVKFASSYTYIIYNLIKSHYHHVYLEIPINNLFRYFNIEEDSVYRVRGHALRTRILDVVKNEINEHTEIELDYEINRVGRKISSVTFTWTRGKLLFRTPREKLKEMHVIADKIQLKGLELLSMPEISGDINKQKMVKNTLKEVLNTITISSNSAFKYEDVNMQLERMKRSYNELIELEKNKDRPEPVAFYNWLEERE